ncbi:MAG: DUF354 domain-containing protein [Candidatus Latescibacterota bacterium]|nr:MAG: DUF354 domain-containing protein [Candidatus Latescibacterota bacterium]
MYTIWVDLDNAPHVPFFAPLIRELEKRGHRTRVTVRDYGYTRDLMDQRGIWYDLIGSHPGKNPFRKVGGLLARVLALVWWARGKQIDAAVSHGSRSLVVACALMRIPCVTMYDYEFVSTSIYNKLSSKVLLPDILPDSLVKKLGLRDNRVAKYPGFKEEVYLGDLSPDPSISEELGVADDQILVVIRPPATAAHYHHPRSERIMRNLLDKISVAENVVGIITPRTFEQAQSVRKHLKDPSKFRILTKPVNGLNLIAHSDLVVGGGGTMNREAALLGVPVYSLFTGKVGTIDRALSDRGMLVFVRSVDDVDRVEFTKRKKADQAAQIEERQRRSAELAAYVCDEIVAVIKPKPA